MEKRYYFRGLGLGIVVTAVIMGIALSGSRSRGVMTDDEVIARAKKLGMIEDSRLLTPSDSDKEESDINEADAQKNGEAETVQTPVKLDVAVAESESEERSGDTSGTEQPSAREDEASDAKPASDTRPAADTNEMTKQDDDTTAETSSSSSAAMKSVTIVSGDGSYTVAQKLAEAGIVNNAASYDDFLCENGYDKRLRTGTFRIPADADDEKIARIVTGQE